jgi:uncharacterized protein (TIGR03083 family)
LNEEQYLRALEENYEAMVAAARNGLEPQVPGCPDWSVGALMGHMIAVYAAWAWRVGGGTGEEIPDEQVDRFPGYLLWLEAGLPRESTPPAVLSWLDTAYGELNEGLTRADPADPVGTWFPPDQTAGFVQRRMAHETAVHRWDAQSAHGEPEQIEPELARDGIDEMLDVHLPMHRVWLEPRANAGERYHFHRIDGDGEWLVVFDPSGEVQVSTEHAKGDVAIRGTASDLLLWLWGRVPSDRLEVIGDRGLAERWFELVPAD